MTRAMVNLCAALGGVASLLCCRGAVAEESRDQVTEASAVMAPETDGVGRRFDLTVSPLSLLLRRYGANLEWYLGDHHALGIGAYYTEYRTSPETNNLFAGVGGEFGYRWYSGQDGPRGIFVGPSLLLARITATPENGAPVDFFNYGAALDVGYQAIIADWLVTSLGVGVQYTQPSQSFPDQELPASILANPGVHPRFLFTLGFAFGD